MKQLITTKNNTKASEHWATKKHTISQRLMPSKKIQTISTQTANTQKTILRILHSLIAEQQQYPDVAVDNNQKGRVKIGFFLYPNGALSNVALLKSSGYPALDEAALLAVNTISPVKEAQKYLQDKQFFSVNVLFE